MSARFSSRRLWLALAGAVTLMVGGGMLACADQRLLDPNSGEVTPAGLALGLKVGSNPLTSQQNPPALENNSPPTPSTADIGQAAAASGTQPGVFVFGTAKVSHPVATLTTRSGAWTLHAAGTQGKLSAYVWTLAGNPNWASAMICQDGEYEAQYVEPGQKIASPNGRLPRWTLSAIAIALPSGTRHAFTVRTAQGTCKIAESGAPVPFHPEWIREAIAAKRTVAYDLERAKGWPGNPPPLLSQLLTPGIGAYQADSQNGSNSSNNYVGITSGQGGEYPASRGFLHDVDTQVIAAAVAGQDENILKNQSAITGYSWATLGLPNEIFWSARHHSLKDPQQPLPGERPYDYRDAATETNPAIDNYLPANGWTFDTAHLINTGWAHWLATEDPRAGLVLQAQLALGLATYYEYKRPVAGMTDYRPHDEQERAKYNVLSAAWKARDVARRITVSAADQRAGLWSRQRVEKMHTDIWAHFSKEINAIRTATPDSGMAWSAKLARRVWMRGDCGDFSGPGGATQLAWSQSAFMDAQYGAPITYLEALDGNPHARWMLATLGRQMTLRYGRIGGALGVDQFGGVRGSAIPLGPCRQGQGPIVPPFNTDTGWADWVVSFVTPTAPRDRFDGAYIHSAVQGEAILRLAADAVQRGLIPPIPDLDDAIAKTNADKARSSRLQFQLLSKHMVTPFAP